MGDATVKQINLDAVYEAGSEVGPAQKRQEGGFWRFWDELTVLKRPEGFWKL